MKTSKFAFEIIWPLVSLYDKFNLSTHILNQKDFNPIVPRVEKRPTTITQLFFVENLPPITRCNIPLIETPEWKN